MQDRELSTLFYAVSSSFVHCRPVFPPVSSTIPVDEQVEKKKEGAREKIRKNTLRRIIVPPARVALSRGTYPIRTSAPSRCSAGTTRRRRKDSLRENRSLLLSSLALSLFPSSVSLPAISLLLLLLLSLSPSLSLFLVFSTSFPATSRQDKRERRLSPSTFSSAFLPGYGI